MKISQRKLINLNFSWHSLSRKFLPTASFQLSASSRFYERFKMTFQICNCRGACAMEIKLMRSKPALVDTGSLRNIYFTKDKLIFIFILYDTIHSAFKSFILCEKHPVTTHPLYWKVSLYSTSVCRLTSKKSALRQIDHLQPSLCDVGRSGSLMV